MKTILLMSITAITGILFGWLYSPSADMFSQNVQCHILLSSRYTSESGDESVESAITLSFSPNKGTIIADSVLTTESNVTIPLLQRMNFTYEMPKNNEYTLKIVNLMDKSLNQRIPEETSPYVRNILNLYLTNPKELKITIRKESNGNYIMYNDIMPWVYCNKGTMHKK